MEAIFPNLRMLLQVAHPQDKLCQLHQDLSCHHQVAMPELSMQYPKNLRKRSSAVHADTLLAEPLQQPPCFKLGFAA